MVIKLRTEHILTGRYLTIFPSGDWQSKPICSKPVLLSRLFESKGVICFATFKIIKPLSGRLTAEDSIP